MNCGDFFSDDLQIEIADTAAAVALWKKPHGESELVALLVGSLQNLKGLLRVGLFIGCLHQRLQYVDREFAGVALQGWLG